MKMLILIGLGLVALFCVHSIADMNRRINEVTAKVNRSVDNIEQTRQMIEARINAMKQPEPEPSSSSKAALDALETLTPAPKPTPTYPHTHRMFTK